jgi:hypothetical protein
MLRNYNIFHSCIFDSKDSQITGTEIHCTRVTCRVDSYRIWSLYEFLSRNIEIIGKNKGYNPKFEWVDIFFQSIA